MHLIKNILVTIEPKPKNCYSTAANCVLHVHVALYVSSAPEKN